MALESGVFVDDLVVTNPPGGDDKRQGDDHLRLIKTVLKNTFKRASRPFYTPGVVNVSTSYLVSASEENITFVCNASGGAFTLTLPNLDASRYGWKIKVVKGDAAHIPVFIQPSSGLINGYAKIRRSSFASVTEVQWVGFWAATRPIALPIGSVVDYWGGTPPNGFLLANGAAVDSGTHPELAALNSFLPDCRERVSVGRSNVQSLLTSAFSGIDSTALGSQGGVQGVQLTTSDIPSHAHAISSSGSASASSDNRLGLHGHAWGSGISSGAGTFTTGGSLAAGYDLNHTHPIDISGTTTVQSGTGATNIKLGTSPGGHTGFSLTDGYNLNHVHVVVVGGSTDNVDLTHAHTISLGGSTQSAGSDGAHVNVQPSIVITKMVVAE